MRFPSTGVRVSWGLGAGMQRIDLLQTLHLSVVVKRELNQNVKLSIYWSSYVPTLIYGHELWVVTVRQRMQIQAAEMRHENLFRTSIEVILPDKAFRYDCGNKFSADSKWAKKGANRTPNNQRHTEGPQILMGL